MLWLAFGYGPKHEFPTTSFLIVSIIYETFFAVGCGYLVAFIARRRELLHAGILSGIFVIGGVLYFIFRLNHYPVWVPLSIIFINAPCVLLGAYLRKKI